MKNLTYLLKKLGEFPPRIAKNDGLNSQNFARKNRKVFIVLDVFIKLLFIENRYFYNILKAVYVNLLGNLLKDLCLVLNISHF